MLLKLLAAFILIPLVELILLLKMAQLTSIFHTITLVIVTGVIGSYLARREGLHVLARFQTAISQGRMPSREIQDGLMIVFAAALLLTPGLLTDAIGFFLLIPAGRELIRRTLLKRYIGRFNVQVISPSFDSSPVPRDSKTIDVDAVDRNTGR